METLIMEKGLREHHTVEGRKVHGLALGTEECTKGTLINPLINLLIL
jgi:hypothetical protein